MTFRQPIPHSVLPDVLPDTATDPVSGERPGLRLMIRRTWVRGDRSTLRPISGRPISGRPIPDQPIAGTAVTDRRAA